MSVLCYVMLDVVLCPMSLLCYYVTVDFSLTLLGVSLIPLRRVRPKVVNHCCTLWWAPEVYLDIIDWNNITVYLISGVDIVLEQEKR